MTASYAPVTYDRASGRILPADKTTSLTLLSIHQGAGDEEPGIQTVSETVSKNNKVLSGG